jgi:uncharacterized membrane protein YvbJ
MERETFINQVLNSANGITQVSPSDELFSKIEQRLAQKQVVSMKTLWLVAASIAILISINALLLSQKTKNTTTELQSAFETSINKSNQLY